MHVRIDNVWYKVVFGSSRKIPAVPIDERKANGLRKIQVPVAFPDYEGWPEADEQAAFINQNRHPERGDVVIDFMENSSEIYRGTDNYYDKVYDLPVLA